MEESRCTGHCCRSFYLPFTPEELADIDDSTHIDGSKIAAMAIPVAPVGQRPHGLAFPMIDPPVVGHYYTCRHLIGNDCSIYDERPRMCRTYPEGQKCNYKGCTSGDAAQEGDTDIRG